MNTQQSVAASISRIINAKEMHDILEVSAVHDKLDLGASFMYKLLHPTMGLIIALVSSGEHQAIMSFV